MEDFDKKVSSLLNMATDSPHLLMEEYQLPNFVASKTWVKHFRSRHKLSLGVSHYERRGQIKKEQ